MLSPGNRHKQAKHELVPLAPGHVNEATVLASVGSSCGRYLSWARRKWRVQW